MAGDVRRPPPSFISLPGGHPNLGQQGCDLSISLGCAKATNCPCHPVSHTPEESCTTIGPKPSSPTRWSPPLWHWLRSNQRRRLSPCRFLLSEIALKERPLQHLIVHLATPQHPLWTDEHLRRLLKSPVPWSRSSRHPSLLVSMHSPQYTASLSTAFLPNSIHAPPRP
jgi:hypothetical protein